MALVTSFCYRAKIEEMCNIHSSLGDIHNNRTKLVLEILKSQERKGEYYGTGII